MVNLMAIALDDSQINALKSGAPVTLANGLTLLKGEDGKAHLVRSKANKKPFTRFEMPVDSGNDVFRLTGEEATQAIKAYREGKGSITCYRTAGADESRAKPETCSIQVDIKVVPNNGVNGMESNRFSEWHIIEPVVRFVKQAYEMGESVAITRKVEEVAL